MKHPIEYIKRRLLARSVVDPRTGCRNWTRATRGGYGRLWDGERVRQATHLAHEAFVGPIPKGKDVLHHCDNPGCIEWRPGHMYAGTPAQNTADMIARGRHVEGRLIGAAKRRGQPSVLRGSRHPKAKLSFDQAREIKTRLEGRNGFTRKDCPAWLAREFGVSDSLIRAIDAGKAWGWL